jgi:hypothetical protein
LTVGYGSPSLNPERTAGVPLSADGRGYAVKAAGGGSKIIQLTQLLFSQNDGWTMLALSLGFYALLFPTFIVANIFVGKFLKSFNTTVIRSREKTGLSLYPTF